MLPCPRSQPLPRRGSDREARVAQRLSSEEPDRPGSVVDIVPGNVTDGAGAAFGVATGVTVERVDPTVFVTGVVMLPTVFVTGVVMLPTVFVTGEVMVPTVFVTGEVMVPTVFVTGEVMVPTVFVTGAVMVPTVFV